MRLLLFTLPLLLLATTAHAQSTTAEAEQLFRDGKRLMGEKKFAEACSAFDASYKLDPTIATHLNVADCREKNGQLATAWGVFLDVQHEARGDKALAGMLKTATDRAQKLEARLSYLTVSVPDESRVEGLVILRNGAPLDSGLWNRAIPVDGGKYTIAGRAPAHEEWTTTVEIANEKGSATVDVPKFKEATVIVEEIAKDTTEPEVKPEPEVVVIEDAPAPGMLTGRRKLAIGVGAIGVVALVGGGTLGFSARGLEDDALALCPGNPCADADEANAMVDRAESRALLANLGYGVGAAAVIGAAVLWFTGAPERRPALEARVSTSFTGLALSGSF